MKIGAIIQARSSSSRLPKKVLKLLPLMGMYLFWHKSLEELKKLI